MARWLAGFAVAIAASASGDALASVSLEVTWTELLHDSTAAVVATPVEARSVWENGRIYTYSRVRVDRAAAGNLAPGADAWVRTMGGEVGKSGQSVDGEAVLTPGLPALLFLHPGPPGAYVVTARGQGQFPVIADAARPELPAHLVRSYAVGALVPPHAAGPVRFAAEVVHGRLVDDVLRDVAAAWAGAHEP